MAQVDRLSALLSRFQMAVGVAQPGEGNLAVIGTAGDQQPSRIEFCPRGTPRRPPSHEVVLIEAVAEWGGETNPLIAALPDCLTLAVADNDETALLLEVLLKEAEANRCGVGSVLSRLGEVLIVRLLRAEIARGAANPGLLSGLADPRVSRAIVAIHEHPGRDWRNDDLADIAGLSLSRFSEVFQSHLGQTPQAYLRSWRMTLARQDLERGDRVKAVSRRYGYASSEALARAFQRQFGKNPLAVRQVKLA